MRLASTTNQTIRRFITDLFDRPWLATDHKTRKDNAPARDYYLLRKSSVLYVYLCKQLRSTLKIVTNTQVLLTHKDDGLPLVVDELVGVSSLKVVDELDEVAVAVLPMVLGAQEVRQLTLASDVVDADLALHQFLHEQ